MDRSDSHKPDEDLEFIQPECDICNETNLTVEKTAIGTLCDECRDLVIHAKNPICLDCGKSMHDAGQAGGKRSYQVYEYIM